MGLSLPHILLLALVVGLGFASFPLWATGIHGR